MQLDMGGGCKILACLLYILSVLLPVTDVSYTLTLFSLKHAKNVDVKIEGISSKSANTDTDIGADRIRRG